MRVPLILIALVPVVIEGSSWPEEIICPKGWTSFNETPGADIPKVALGTISLQPHRASKRSEVWEYLNIPYAAPPTGELRFSAPVEVDTSPSWPNEEVQGKEIDGRYFSASCPGERRDIKLRSLLSQNGKRLLDISTGQNSTYSEDCLKLNVWTGTPPLPTPLDALCAQITGNETNDTIGKPIMIWLTENAADPRFNGQHWAADENIVVVTVNSRRGPFGFANPPTEMPNVGFLDQRMAVEWVHKNALQFGGDPSRITLAGHGWGGHAVSYYSKKWKLDPLVRAFITQSPIRIDQGNPFIPLAPNIPFRNPGHWPALIALGKLGCSGPNSTPDSTKNCMYEKSWTEIFGNASSISIGNQYKDTMAFQPNIYSTEPDVLEREFSDLPLLTGTLAHETPWTTFQKGFQDPLHFYTGNNLSEQLHIMTKRPVFGKERSIIVFNGSREDIWDLFWWKCPTTQLVEQRLNGKAPVYQYEWSGSFDSMQLVTGTNVWHGSEIAIQWGTVEETTGIAPSKKEIDMGRHVRRLWAAFVRDPSKGLKSAGWPAMDKPLQKALLLGDAPETKPRIGRIAGVGKNSCKHVSFLNRIDQLLGLELKEFLPISDYCRSITLRFTSECRKYLSEGIEKPRPTV